MDVATWIALLSVAVSSITLYALLTQRRSFGAYTERIERANALVRQSDELTRQSNVRVIDEIRANADIYQQAVERNEVIHKAMQDALIDLRSA